MMSVLNTPYPKSTVLKFTKFLAGISIMIAFILIVLQPFGTASFSHPFKYEILAGYGIVIYVSGSLFFSFIDHFLSDAIKDKWTVGYEIGLLFCTILISQTSCYFYWVWLFGTGISIMAFLNFLIIATSVSILPVGFYLLYIYQKYRDVHHARSIKDELTDTEKQKDGHIEDDILSPNADHGTIKITGTGKSEKYQFYSRTLIMIVAEDNYVIVHSLENQKLKKWMIRATMNEVENQLNQSFIRIHRSYIINKNYIEDITGNVTNTRIKLKDIDIELPVSRAKVGEIRQL
jgi:hypothetical protein